MALEPLSAGDPAQLGEFVLRARLGAGGMGLVYLAYTPGGRPVALKVVRPEFGADADFRERFRREVAAAGRVHGLFTAQVLAADPDGTPPWLATTYVPGPSLQEAVARFGAMPPGTVVQLLGGVAEALAAIHGAGVVHRDLKPSNVLLASDGPRVIDFGIAQAVDASSLTRRGDVIGSPQFMAPEQILGRQSTPALDVFALGHLAAYALLGRSPFAGDDQGAVARRILHDRVELPGCPPELRELIDWCMSKDPTARPTPGQVVTACRTLALRAPQVTETWLPPAIATTLGQYVPPAAPVGPMAAPMTPPPAAYSAAPPTVYQANPVTLPYQAAGSPGVAGPGYGLGPGDPASAAPGTPRRRVSGLQAAIAVVAVAAVAGTIGALVASHGTSSSSTAGQTSGGAIGGANSGSVVNSQAAGTHTTAANTTAANTAAANTHTTVSQSPSIAANLDPCVVGSWQSTDQHDSDTVNGTPVTLTGTTGASVTVGPDGATTITYSHDQVSGQLSGNTLTITVDARRTSTVTTPNGQIQDSNAAASGTETLAEDGVTITTVPYTNDNGQTSYTCSGNTLQITSTTPGTAAGMGTETDNFTFTRTSH